MVFNRYPGELAPHEPLTRQEVTKLFCFMSEEERGKVLVEIRKGIERLRMGLPCGGLVKLMERALGPVRTEELLSLNKGNKVYT